MKLASHVFRPAAFLILSVLGLPPASAVDQSTSTVSSQPAKSYTDQGTVTDTVTVTNYGGMGSNGWNGNSFSQNSYSVIQTYHPIYFPPEPPPLGTPLVPVKPQSLLAKFAPPAELKEYLYESFFAPLSTLLFTEDLSRARRARLDAYRSARQAALSALRAKLEAVKNADPETRQRELEAFARQQTPDLAALETAAEELRTNLVHGTWFENGVDWNDSRNWRLGDNTRWESQTDEIKVVQGAAYFQDGLLPTQRLLLRELAMELADSLQAPTADIALDQAGPYFYFSPATARIELPAALPPALAAKIADYQARKAVLKKELRDLLYKNDRAFFESTRINAMKALAVQQAAQIAALEQLAEEIRLGLAPLPMPGRPELANMPSELHTRIMLYLGKKTAWQNTMMARLATLKSEFPEDRVEFDRTAGGLTIQIVANRHSSDAANAKRDAGVAALRAFNSEQLIRYAELAREKTAISEAVVKVVLDLAAPGSNKSIDRLLQEFAFAFKVQERWERYGDYETAVLQPGLSPEQRRLLFGAGLQTLDLPLVSQ